jgi:hypothetical protein
MSYPLIAHNAELFSISSEVDNQPFIKKTLKQVQGDFAIMIRSRHSDLKLTRSYFLIN